MALSITATDYHLRSSRAMDQPTNAPFTLCAWVKMNWAVGSKKSLIGIFGGVSDTALISPTVSVQIGTQSGNNDLSFWARTGSKNSNLTVLGTTATGFMAPYNNTWIFVAITNDGTTNRCYLNGVEIATSTTSLSSGYLNQIYINGYPNGNNDETAIFQCGVTSFFNRALSPGELLTMYTIAGSSHGIVFGLKAKYQFDELPADFPAILIPDMSGNGNMLLSTGSGAQFTYTYEGTIATNHIRPVQ